MNKDNEYEIPERATVRHEHVRCGNPDCQHLHGPYLYAYWKDGKRLRKRYIGKTIGDLLVRKVGKKSRYNTNKNEKTKSRKRESTKGKSVGPTISRKTQKWESHYRLGVQSTNQ
ncbi:MAG: hypothetical protein WBE34_07915 [Candidatus Nitrosopolaris sp.]